MKFDFLLQGSHPAFYWMAALLREKGKTVAVVPGARIHSWEVFPVEALSSLGLESSEVDRDSKPIQILTSDFRMGIFADPDLTKTDLLFCSGETATSELIRGLSFYAKGSDYPAVFGESSNELLQACHQMKYFEKKSGELEIVARQALKEKGVEFLEEGSTLPEAEQTVILDFSRAKVLRTQFEISIPLKELPVGATDRMLFVERNSPLMEMLFESGVLRVRTLLPSDPQLVQRMLTAIENYFPMLDPDAARITEIEAWHHEWTEAQSHVDASKPGIWRVSPALNPERGERSLYVRLSELLSKKYKKPPLFSTSELFGTL